MTRPHGPPGTQAPRSDRQMARDVARHLDRRRGRRRLLVWTTLLALVGAAALYLRCGDGLGLGLGGGGQGIADLDQTEAPRVEAGPRRCQVRVSASRTGATVITVDGKPMGPAEAVVTCKGAGAADVVVTGDAREGDWKDLRSALENAGVTDISVR